MPLLGVFAILVAHSWLAWGDVDADYGREMYVPVRLLEGDVLYRDIRYPYGPFSPYLHMVGYGLWRPHLAVLYVDGIASAALVLVLVYDIARALGGPATASLTAALVMVDLVFVPGSAYTFSLIFPYAYPALHGLLFLLASIAGGFRLLAGNRRMAALVAGAGAGLALLTKPEFGAASLAVVMATSAGLALRGTQGLRNRLLCLWTPTVLLPAFGYGLLATAMPPTAIVTRGLFAPEYFQGSRVIGWLIAGLVPNATWQQNATRTLMHWATSVPLYACGLAIVGVSGALALPLACRLTASRWAAPAMGVLAAGVTWTACWSRFPPVWYAPPVGIVRGRYALIPPLLAGTLCVSSGVLARQIMHGDRLGLTALRYWILAFVGLALLARVPAHLVPGSYADFYLPIGIALLVHLVVDRLPMLPCVPVVSRASMQAAVAGLLTGLALYVAACNWQWWPMRNLEIVTSRGTLRVQPDPRTLAFRQALAWVAHYAPPEGTVLSLPRGTALSFLSGHGNALYETSLEVTVATSAQERAYIAALEHAPPELIVTSALAQREYGLGPWGVEIHQRIRRWIEKEYAAKETVNVPGYGAMTLWIRRAGVPRGTG